jgi:hypothetical protein
MELGNEKWGGLYFWYWKEEEGDIFCNCFWLVFLEYL